MYGYCLPAAFSLAEPSPDTTGLAYATTQSESSAPAPHPLPPLRYGAEAGIGTALGAVTMVGAIFPALLLTVVPPQGGCGCPPPPREHPCSCWAIAMFPAGAALGASTGIMLTDKLLLPDERPLLLPPLIGSIAAAALVTVAAAPAYREGDLSTEALVFAVGGSAAITGTLTNALFGPTDGRDAWSRERSTGTASSQR